MRVFRRVAECGSFTGAAEQIGISNAAVSKQVQKLESHLRAQLLHRTTRSLSLTEAGKVYLERAAAILDALEESDALMAGMRFAPRGRLRLALPLLFGTRFVAPVLPEFLAKYPEVQVDCELADRFVDIVDEGVDLALRIVTDLPDSALVARRLGSVGRVVCASPAYLRKHAAPRKPDDLASHDCVRYGLASTGDQWRFDLPQGMLVVRVSGSRRVNDSVGARAAVVAGYGVALLPRFIVAEDLDAGRLVELLDRFPAERHSLWALRPASRHEPAKVRAFIEFIAERFGTSPPWDSGRRQPRVTVSRRRRSR